MKDKLVIGTPFGGLGDHLFLSSIPRLYKSIHPLGKVFLSARSKFRNWEIYPLIWQSNPYLDGIVDEEIEPLLSIEKNDPKGINIMDVVHEKLSLPFVPGQSKPEIYIESSLKNSKEKRCYELIDLNYISFVGAITRKDLKNIINTNISDSTIFVNPAKWIKDIWPEVNSINTNSLFHYCELIQNCSKLVVLTSGGAVLGSALNKNCHVYYGYGVTELFLFRNNHNFLISEKSIKNNLIYQYYQKKNLLRYNKSGNYIGEPSKLLILISILGLFLKVFKKLLFKIKL
tara:strand:+ start:58 stop:918 length:861 start_codon:yes stop_codon:yes gene_type:complete